MSSNSDSEYVFQKQINSSQPDTLAFLTNGCNVEGTVKTILDCYMKEGYLEKPPSRMFNIEILLILSLLMNLSLIHI